jgi:hypothetical protein
MALGAAPLIPMKILQHKDISHLFFCGVTLVGIKSMMLAACNSQNKFHEKCPVGIKCCIFSHKLKSIKKIALKLKECIK